MHEMRIVNVFTNQEGEFGNPLGIVVDERGLFDKERRQQIAVKSGFSEVVFINSIENKNISIYSPQREIPFAGHAIVGASYFLRMKYKISVTQLVGIKGTIETWEESGLTWVRGELSITPHWNYEQLSSSSLIESISTEQSVLKEHTVVWAWLDEVKGIIRARTFASDWGIPEDEANGSGSMKLAASLKKELILYHGKGSIIYARPSKSGFAEVGGLVELSRGEKQLPD